MPLTVVSGFWDPNISLLQTVFSGFGFVWCGVARGFVGEPGADQTGLPGSPRGLQVCGMQDSRIAVAGLRLKLLESGFGLYGYAMGYMVSGLSRFTKRRSLFTRIILS